MKPNENREASQNYRLLKVQVMLAEVFCSHLHVRKMAKPLGMIQGFVSGDQESNHQPNLYSVLPCAQPHRRHAAVLQSLYHPVKSVELSVARWTNGLCGTKEPLHLLRRTQPVC